MPPFPLPPVFALSDTKYLTNKRSAGIQLCPPPRQPHPACFLLCDFAWDYSSQQENTNLTSSVGPGWEEAVGRHGRRGGRFHRVWKSKRSSSETPHIRQSLLDTAQSTLNVQVTEHECWWMRLNGGWLHWEKQRHNHELLGKSDDSIWSTEVCLQSMIFRSIQRVQTQDLSLGLWECVCLTVREGDLEWLGGVSEVPQRQAAVRVTAHELLPFVMPADRVDGLHRSHRVSVSLKVIKHFKWIIVSCSAMRKKPDWGRGTRSPAADPTRRRARRAAVTKVHRRTEASSNEL